MGFTLFEIVELIVLMVVCIMIVLWIYRPKSLERYDQYSKIPLKDEDDRGKE